MRWISRFDIRTTSLSAAILVACVGCGPSSNGGTNPARDAGGNTDAGQTRLPGPDGGSVTSEGGGGGGEGGRGGDSGGGGTEGGSNGSCTGTGPANVTVTPSMLSFGSETLQEATSKSLITVRNIGTSAVAINDVAITGSDPGDFSETNDCPASLPSGDSCYVRAAYTPSATGSRTASVAINGGCASTLSGTGVSLAAGFYISPTGDDTNGDGSLGNPWATLPRAQQGMQASNGATMTTYLRAGVYSPASIDACGGCGLNLGAADNGETWSYYPPDGIDSAIIDGGSSTTNVGLVVVLGMGGSSNVTFNGLTVRNFYGWGIGGDNSSSITVKNNIVYNGFSTDQYGAQGIACGEYCQSWSILNNVMHDITGGGANIVSATDGNISHLIYSGNFVYNTCTSNQDGGDCGALYLQDGPAQSTDITVSGNFIRDGNPWRGMNAGSAIYLDDCLSNATVTGNVMTGTNGANTTFIHGGMNDVYAGNIIDLGSYAQAAGVQQQSQAPNCNIMTGNAYTSNILISSNGGGGWGSLSWPDPAYPNIANNVFWAYAGGAIVSSSDTNPVLSDPLLSGCYSLAAISPAYAAPTSFSPLLQDWGPPGYEMPSGASIPPSYPSPTCE